MLCSKLHPVHHSADNYGSPHIQEIPPPTAQCILNNHRRASIYVHGRYSQPHGASHGITHLVQFSPPTAISSALILRVPTRVRTATAAVFGLLLVEFVRVQQPWRPPAAWCRLLTPQYHVVEILLWEV